MDRRSLLRGGLSLIAAPAIVQASSLMPVRGLILRPEPLERGLIAAESILWGDILKIGDDGRAYRMNAIGRYRLAGVFCGGAQRSIEPGGFIPDSHVQLSGTLIKLIRG